MRYRSLDASGDMMFGGGILSFFVNQPEAVAQAVNTRLRLLLGEFWLDTSAGTPWATQVLGSGTTPTYDAVIRARILRTSGVLSMLSYSSSLISRRLAINASIVTIYSPAAVPVSATL